MNKEYPEIIFINARYTRIYAGGTEHREITLLARDMRGGSTLAALFAPQEAISCSTRVIPFYFRSPKITVNHLFIHKLWIRFRTESIPIRTHTPKALSHTNTPYALAHSWTPRSHHHTPCCLVGHTYTYIYNACVFGMPPRKRDIATHILIAHTNTHTQHANTQSTAL